MNRRRFLELLGTAALGSGIVYSFPSVIVPKNLSVIGTPLYWSDQVTFRVVDTPEFEFGFSGFKPSDTKTHLTIEAIIKNINSIFYKEAKQRGHIKSEYANSLLKQFNV